MLGWAALGCMNECEDRRQFAEMLLRVAGREGLVLNFLEVDVFALSGLEYLAFVRTAGATVGA